MDASLGRTEIREGGHPHGKSGILLNVFVFAVQVVSRPVA
jgi:hypothetical protein